MGHLTADIPAHWIVLGSIAIVIGVLALVGLIVWDCLRKIED